MKRYGFWDRALIFLFAVLSAGLAVITALRAFDIDMIGSFCGNLADNAPGIVWKLIICGLGAIYVLLAVYTVIAISPARERRSDFVTLDAGEGNNVRIAVSAIRDMAEQAVYETTNLESVDVDVSGEGESITVSIAMTVQSGTNVPQLTGEIQRTVKKYIEEKCGVGVHGVTVTIKSVSATAAETDTFGFDAADSAEEYGGLYSPKKADNIFAEEPEAAPASTEETVSETEAENKDDDEIKLI